MPTELPPKKPAERHRMRHLAVGTATASMVLVALVLIARHVVALQLSIATPEIARIIAGAREFQSDWRRGADLRGDPASDDMEFSAQRRRPAPQR